MDTTLDLLTLEQETRSFPIVRFKTETRSAIFQIHGEIGNSVTTSQKGAERTRRWKILVASSVKEGRGLKSWSPQWEYVVSIAFFFSRRPQLFDIENYMKPLIDAIAAGLYCEENEEFTSTAFRYNFDDSNFRHLFVTRLPDVDTKDEEGVLIDLSTIGK